MTQSAFESAQVFGHYLETLPAGEEYLTLHFSPTSTPRKKRWSNYGLSADFLGDYFAAFFPGDEVPDSKINRKESVKATVSYIANELLENAVKYSDEITNLPISISLHLYEQAIIFQVINHAQAAAVEKYQQFIQELLHRDLEELYTQQLEQTALGAGESHMGLLTMMNDYSAQFGWKFETLAEPAGISRISVIAHLEV